MPWDVFDTHPRASRGVALVGLVAVLAVYAFLGMDPRASQRFVWAAPVAAGSFFGAQLLLPRCSIRVDAPLCPLNWALYCFGLQLVVMPLVTSIFGADPATMPRLPTNASITTALLLGSASFICFAMGAHFVDRARESRGPSRASASLYVPQGPFAAVCIALGGAGLLVKFGDLSTMLRALMNPLLMAEMMPAGGAGVAEAAGLLLRPFMWTGVIVAWGLWLDRGGGASRGSRFAITAAVVAAVVISGATYSFNRSTFFMPILAMAGAYSARISRISFKKMGVGALVAIATALAVGAYRWNAFDAATLLRDARARTRLVDDTNVLFQVQMYGQAPQFLAFLIESARSEHAGFGPGTLVASVLSPVPVLGKRYREVSGVAEYNRLIYGNTGIADQPVPFEGEVFLALGAGGLAVAFLVLGAIVARLEAAFRAARSVFDAYVAQTTTQWLVFLIQASLLSVSQVFVYYFGPIYAYLLVGASLRALRRRRGFPAVSAGGPP